MTTRGDALRVEGTQFVGADGPVLRGTHLAGSPAT
jgi:hypothetical protein